MNIIGAPRRAATIAMLWIVALALAGCDGAPIRDPEFASVRPVPMPAQSAPPAYAGAIFQPGYNVVLFEDLRARRVGDILTVVLEEQTDAAKSAETTVAKDTNSSVTNPTILGTTPQFNVPSFLPLASTRDNTLASGVQSSHDFDGAAESTQSNSLSGEISVSVAEVLPNGDLVVQGEKLLSLNQGHEHVRFSGTVRQADIRSDNTVSSTRVGNARIIYAGEGAVADANVLGWLARFFVSAFFPF